jgi:hypothetical protein
MAPVATVALQRQQQQQQQQQHTKQRQGESHKRRYIYAARYCVLREVSSIQQSLRQQQSWILLLNTQVQS